MEDDPEFIAQLKRAFMAESSSEIPLASTRLSNYQSLVNRAVDVFGDEVRASRWLSLRTRDFGGRSPIEVAQSTGYDPAEMARIFEPVFTRIEHGIDN
jgi:uncharacterized protein (DUF2384 family)